MLKCSKIKIYAEDAMEYGININFFANKIGLEKAAELVSKAGFTQLDYTPHIKLDTWREEMGEAMKIFDAYGLEVHQTHAPFNRYGGYDNHALCLDRCAEATEFTGAKYMVAHADEFDFDGMAFSPEAAYDYNRKIYLPYVERAEKGGYKVAFETVFEDGYYKGRRYTSDADELYNFITDWKSDAACCCWDFGHANVQFKEKAPDVIRRFGSLIECTHLHDNSGNDSHQMPMTGDINWTETMNAFHDFGYNGIMSVEYAHGEMPEYLVGDFIDLTFKSAKHVWEV